MKLGILADTHGYLSPRVHPLFEGVDTILHAGDIGASDILLELETIAPVVAVFGNMDRFAVRASLSDMVIQTFAEVRFLLIHDLGVPYAVKRSLRPIIKQHQPRVIVFGHTHVPYNRRLGPTLFFNPGSASSDRSGRCESVGIITLSDAAIHRQIIPLEA
jgi:uncharacterized protein